MFFLSSHRRINIDIKKEKKKKPLNDLLLLNEDSKWDKNTINTKENSFVSQ